MLRFLFRRIPRFGFLTLFAAMLLFVSVAGWAKWHLDLWQEEESLLADLGDAGVTYSLVRQSGDLTETWPRARPLQPSSIPLWDEAVPYFSRIQGIIIRNEAPYELLERTARLPYIEAVKGEWTSPNPVPPEAIAAKVGFDLTPLDPPTIPASIAPIDAGDALGEGEADQALSRFLEAWRSSRTGPRIGTRYCVRAVPARTSAFYARDDRALFIAVEGYAGILKRDVAHGLGHYNDGFRQQARESGTPQYFETESAPLIQFDPREALDRNLTNCGIADSFLDALRSPQKVQVERIDDQRARLEISPIVRSYPSVDCEDIYTVSLVARSDLDWEMEAWDIVGVRKEGENSPANLPAPAAARYRGVLRGEQDWVVAEEWVADDVAGPLAPIVRGQPPRLVTASSSGVARYDFSPDLDLSHVAPERFDAKMLPPPRTLPWLRWYRVTFLLGCGLAVMLMGRRFMSTQSKAEAPNEPREPDAQVTTTT